jgi:hypothetical protein
VISQDRAILACHRSGPDGLHLATSQPHNHQESTMAIIQAPVAASKSLAAWLQKLTRQRATPAQSGASQACDATAAPLPAVIPEAEVTDVALAQVLESGNVEARLDAHGVLRCRTLSGHRLSVAVQDGTRVVQVWTIMGGDPEQRDRLEAAASRINNELAALRCAIDKDGDIVMDLAVSYCGGLIPRQLLHVVALLEAQAARAACHLRT